MSVRVVLIALLMAGCAATPSVVTKTEPARARPDDLAARREREARPPTVDSDRVERYDRLVVFTGNVVARFPWTVQYADRIEIYLDAKRDHIVRTVSIGNVRIVTGILGTATARQAEYYERRQIVVLRGNGQVRRRWRLRTDVVRGACLVMYLRQSSITPCPHEDDIGELVTRSGVVRPDDV